MKYLFPFALLLLFACSQEPVERAPMPVVVNAQSEIAPSRAAGSVAVEEPETVPSGQEVEKVTPPPASAEPSKPAERPTRKKAVEQVVPKKKAAPAERTPKTEKAPVRQVSQTEQAPVKKKLSDTPTQVRPPAEVSIPVERPRRSASPAPVSPPPAPVAEASAAPAPVTRTAGYPVISFESTLWNFGELDEGETVDHKFKFRNTGDAPLEITNTTATCGCTKPLYPFMPIMPGEEGYISVRYNSKGKFGNQRPIVTVSANTKEGTHKLYLEGSVKTEVVGN